MFNHTQSLLINNSGFNNVLLAFFQRLKMLVTAEFLYVTFTAFVQLQNRFQTIMVSNFPHNPVGKQILLSVDVFGKLQMQAQHTYTAHQTRHSILRHVFFIVEIYFVGLIFKLLKTFLHFFGCSFFTSLLRLPVYFF